MSQIEGTPRTAHEQKLAAARRLNEAHARQDTDPGPVPPPTEQDRQLARRIRAIAAIHSLAAWFTDNPDAPLPWLIEVEAEPLEDRAAPDDARLNAMDRFAELHSASRSARGPHHFAEIPLATEKHHGVEIRYVMSTTVKGR